MLQESQRYAAALRNMTELGVHPLSAAQPPSSWGALPLQWARFAQWDRILSMQRPEELIGQEEAAGASGNGDNATALVGHSATGGAASSKYVVVVYHYTRALALLAPPTAAVGPGNDTSAEGGGSEMGRSSRGSHEAIDAELASLEAAVEAVPEDEYMGPGTGVGESSAHPDGGRSRYKAANSSSSKASQLLATLLTPTLPGLLNCCCCTVMNRRDEQPRAQGAVADLPADGPGQGAGGAAGQHQRGGGAPAAGGGYRR